ncbi:Dbl-like domain-containing protein [Auricularia subglabra TFB-10046 SS5]|uniref:Dbl-like domain-containing protein n=1 Tax=Auricularia subglabra (strain TFB-10046 / SS5) TaxID=717982 RepID=J0CTC4_AURST|nr:Dbl-like domain-containing protein [Auricularia subglabra TFB-10046 SS5]
MSRIARRQVCKGPAIDTPRTSLLDGKPLVVSEFDDPVEPNPVAKPAPTTVVRCSPDYSPTADNAIRGSAASTPNAHPFPSPATLISKQQRADLERRRHALLELVDSEQLYVTSLHTLLNIYLARLPSLLPSLDARIVTRNLADLLAFHTELARLLAHAAYHDANSVDSAIRAVAQVFLDTSSGFSIYDNFCHGHRDAAMAIRPFESRPEYAVFERVCAAVASSVASPCLQHTATGSQECISILTASFAHMGRSRPHSVHATPSSRPSSSSGPPQVASTRAPSLHFADLLIMPVQRICRYPLLLVQLVPACSKSEDDVIQAAINAMRCAAASADEASRRADAAHRSQLIRTRIAARSSVPVLTPKELLPVEFLAALGVVRFAASLDVAHYSPAAAEPKARCMGIFLYDGGFIVLVKVHRNKTYEPKYWFALTSACSVQEHATGFSFQITTRGHHFDCYPASECEKRLHLAEIADARAAPARWVNGDSLHYKSPRSAPSSLSSRASRAVTSTFNGVPNRLNLERRTLRPKVSFSPSQRMQAELGLDDVTSSSFARARKQAQLAIALGTVRTEPLPAAARGRLREDVHIRGQRSLVFDGGLHHHQPVQRRLARSNASLLSSPTSTVSSGSVSTVGVSSSGEQVPSPVDSDAPAKPTAQARRLLDALRDVLLYSSGSNAVS